MKIRKMHLAFALLCLLYNTAANAQTEPQNAYVTTRLQDSVYEQPVFQRPISVSIGLGSAGIGASGKLRFSPHWYGRFGFSTLPIIYSGAIKLYGYNTDFKVSTNFTNIHLFAEYQPFRTTSVRVVGGFAYFVSGNVKGTIKNQDPVSYGQIVLQPSDVGEVDATIDWKGLAPYLGIGLFKGIPKKQFGVNLDLGTYYFVSQKVTMTGTKLLENNNQNEQQLKENLNSYRWLPVLQINFSYRLSKQ